MLLLERHSPGVEKMLFSPRHIYIQMRKRFAFHLIFAWFSPLSLRSKVTLVWCFLTNRLRTAVSIPNSYPCRLLCCIFLYHTYLFLLYLIIYLFILMFIFLQPQYELHKKRHLVCFVSCHIPVPRSALSIW